MTPNKQGIQ
ncbi:hypothetical protein YPPY11_0640, partial [Yersinia pestis PY-11]